MEDNNKEKTNIFWNFIKRYWLIIILLIALPMIFNVISLLPIGWDIFNEPNSWTGIWAEYGGALVSTGAAFYILYEQKRQNHEENERNRKLQEDAIRQNHEENEYNRNLQTNVIKYQYKVQWLMNVKVSLTEFQKAHNVNAISDFISDIYSYYQKQPETTHNNSLYEDRKPIFEKMLKIFTNIQDTSITYRLWFPKDELLDKKEKEYLKILEDLTHEYLVTINDFKWILANFNSNSYLYPEQIKILVENYKKYYITDIKNHSNFVIIFEKNEYQFYENPGKILSERFDLFSKRIKGISLDTISDLIKYEEDKIEGLLNTDNNKHYSK